MSLAEAARALGIPKGSIGTQVHPEQEVQGYDQFSSRSTGSAESAGSKFTVAGLGEGLHVTKGQLLRQCPNS